MVAISATLYRNIESEDILAFTLSLFPSFTLAFPTSPCVNMCEILLIKIYKEGVFYLFFFCQ